MSDNRYVLETDKLGISFGGLKAADDINIKIENLLKALVNMYIIQIIVKQLMKIMILD